MAKTPVEGGQGTLRSEDIVVVGVWWLGIGNWEDEMKGWIDVIDGKNYCVGELPKVACMRYVSEGLNVSEAESFEARFVRIEALA